MTIHVSQAVNTPITSVGSLTKPRLLFFRSQHNLPRFIRSYDSLPLFIRSHLLQQIKCLSHFFDVSVITTDGDYAEICDKYRPDITVVESGVYGGPPIISNRYSRPDIPKIGFLHADAYCFSRGAFLSEMERWGIDTYFTISVSMREYLPTLADRVFVWPNFVDPDIFRDYGQPKVIPVLFTGSCAMHYPWRNRIKGMIAQHFPSLSCPHFGWFDAKSASRMLCGEQYARMINSSYVVPTCGTIAREVVRKHFEIPASNSCLVTERTAALEAAGFVDMQNCVFANEENILDKLEYLFEKPDVLQGITSSGHLLVHSQHTERQRNQILQWFKLHNSLQPGQRIIQSDPFQPLTIVNIDSKVANCLGSCGGVDRALLRKGDVHLRRGDYNEAERYYLSCLNYHIMPEPMLGLALCNLYKGDARKAREWISQSIGHVMEIYHAADPDPVEWAYFIISLLCQGNISEAKRRADQFPLLQHQELERCKRVVYILCCSTLSGSEERHNQTGARARPSLHQLPQRDMAGWVRELCRMLTACRQDALAEQVHKKLLLQSVLLSNSLEHARTKPFTRSAQPKSILPLIEEPFRMRIRRRLRQWIPSRVRAQMRRLIMVNRRDDFASATQAWAQEAPAINALILGASYRSTYTSAFLDGIRKNPSMPKVLCIGPLNYHFKQLAKGSADCPQIQFTSRPLHTLMEEVKLACFDIALIDDYASAEEESLELLRGIKTILIRNVNTYFGFTLAQKLLSEGEYHIAYEGMARLTRSIIFTKKHPVSAGKAAAGRSINVG